MNVVSGKELLRLIGWIALDHAIFIDSNFRSTKEAIEIAPWEFRHFFSSIAKLRLRLEVCAREYGKIELWVGLDRCLLFLFFTHDSSKLERSEIWLRSILAEHFFCLQRCVVVDDEIGRFLFLFLVWRRTKRTWMNNRASDRVIEKCRKLLSLFTITSKRCKNASLNYKLQITLSIAAESSRLLSKRRREMLKATSRWTNFISLCLWKGLEKREKIVHSRCCLLFYWQNKVIFPSSLGRRRWRKGKQKNCQKLAAFFCLTCPTKPDETQWKILPNNNRQDFMRECAII